MITVTDTVTRTMCASTYYISTYSLLDTRTIYIGSVYLEWRDLVTEPPLHFFTLPKRVYRGIASEFLQEIKTRKYQHVVRTTTEEE